MTGKLIGSKKIFYNDGELDENSTCAKIVQVQKKEIVMFNEY